MFGLAQLQGAEPAIPDFLLAVVSGDEEMITGSLPTSETDPSRVVKDYINPWWIDGSRCDSAGSLPRGLALHRCQVVITSLFRLHLKDLFSWVAQLAPFHKIYPILITSLGNCNERLFLVCSGLGNNMTNVNERESMMIYVVRGRFHL